VLATNLVLGLALAGLGATFLVRRHHLAWAEVRRSRMQMGETGWVAVGFLLTLAGLVQIALTLI
jgi:hypothetical protein